MRWGWEAHKYLYQLSERAVDESDKKNGGKFKSCWRRCFSVALQSCNAKVLSKKISRRMKNIDCIEMIIHYNFVSVNGTWVEN